MVSVRAVLSFVLGSTLLLGPGMTRATAAPGDPEDVAGLVARAGATSSGTWTRNDPTGDERATSAMRKRFPRKARAVDISRQRYTYGIGGLTIVTHLKRVIKGKAPYRQFVHQVVVGRTDGVTVRVHLKGRFRGRSTVTSSTGATCTGSVFNVSRRSNLAVAFIPLGCLPDSLTRVRTTSFNEHGPTDISVDRMSAAVP